MVQKVILKKECSECGSDYAEEKIQTIFDALWCDDCISNTLNTCVDCNEWAYSDDMRYVEGHGDICEGCCDENYFYCDGCSNYMNSGRYHCCDDYCNECCNCSEDDSNESDAEDISIPNNFEKSKSYVLNKHKNFCGVEIECVNSDLYDNDFRYEKLKEFGFSQTSDGSLGSDGVEFVSIAMNGDDLFNKVNSFCNALKEKDYKISSDCGLHIHIGVSKRVDFLKKVFLFYKKYEEYFFDMASPSRKGNSYCRKLSNVMNFEDLEVLNFKDSYEFQSKMYNTKSKSRLRSYKRNKYNDNRYSWVNFHSVFHRGTLEIRNHNGTINQEKIINWLKIHLTIINKLKNFSNEMISHFPKDEKFFLSLFDKEMADYIKSRWNKFNPKTEILVPVNYNPSRRRGVMCETPKGSVYHRNMQTLQLTCECSYCRGEDN